MITSDQLRQPPIIGAAHTALSSAIRPPSTQFFRVEHGRGDKGWEGDEVIGGFEPKLGSDCTSILCLTSKYIDNVVNVILSILMA